MCGVKKTVSKMHKLPSTKYSTWYHYLPFDFYGNKNDISLEISTATKSKYVNKHNMENCSEKG